ncbi:hypothetical protein CJ739_69 [Mariniflexile rhizosphaerae]|uniref:DUF6712 family protein n=1 Tax=unclassified Mariniflexile TaxID=2643887 RepID=UPI000E334F41|nr:DUF6712 family protein [Mariniflexile sp. TRM1-10]AXP79169.1 hypothetical protein CJ739_69 [Mariniflexile sp. TRM1-10]
MKLLFDFNPNKGSDELKALIGHIDKDINFVNLKSDIESATTDLIKIIGQPVYDAVLAKYEAGSALEADIELIFKVRYPIALNGYSSYARASDVQHGNNGRKIRVDEKYKVPFEWMIDRDNEIFERKYYKAVDDLIDYLDATSATWKASNAYKDSQKYFVRLTSDFDEFFPINSRLLLMKLQPGFRQCERKSIVPLITQTTYDALKLKLEEATVLTSEENILISLIKEACVYHALAWGMRVLRVALFPEGVLQRFTSDRMSTKATKPPEKMEAELAAQEFTKQAKEALNQIERIQTAAALTEPDPEVVKAITTPTYKFDDCDGFVSF